MSDAEHLTLDVADKRARVTEYVKKILKTSRPSARELVSELDRAIGIVARWDLVSVLKSLLADKDLRHAERDYLASLLQADDFIPALRGEGAPDQDTSSTIDALLQASAQYRKSAAFREMID